jgi:hypothetical protein
MGILDNLEAFLDLDLDLKDLDLTEDMDRAEVIDQ